MVKDDGRGPPDSSLERRGRTDVDRPDARRLRVPGAGRDAELGFLAAPGEVIDWRLVVAFDAAASIGVFDALPAALPQLAYRCGLEMVSLRALVDQLAVWGIVTLNHDQVDRGPAAPDQIGAAMLRRHADVLRRWTTTLAGRLRSRVAEPDDRHRPAPRPVLDAVGLELLALHQRPTIAPVVDRCLTRFPQTVRVLDLGGGHGEHAAEFARRGLDVTLQDLPGVIDVLELRADRSPLPFATFVGDLRTSLPAGQFDLVLISAVTNLFDADDNRALMRRLHDLVAPGGGVAIVTYLRGSDPVAAVFALQMLVWTDGGDAHAEADHLRWLSDAGFRDVDVEPISGSEERMVLAAR